MSTLSFLYVCICVCVCVGVCSKEKTGADVNDKLSWKLDRKQRKWKDEEEKKKELLSSLKLIRKCQPGTQ